MTKKLRNELLAVLARIERVQTFIMSERVAVCSVSDKATTSLHYTRAYVPGLDRSERDALPLTRMAKDIGSELCLLPQAIRDMQRVLAD